MRIRGHALTRWIARAPLGLNHIEDLLLAATTGRVVREEGGTRWVVGLGMVLVIRHNVVITCWRANRKR